MMLILLIHESLVMPTPGFFDLMKTHWSRVRGFPLTLQFLDECNYQCSIGQYTGHGMLSTCNHGLHLTVAAVPRSTHLTLQ